MSETPSLEHVATLSDDAGIIQHAVETVPDRDTGYCTDDVARGFMVALMRLRVAPRDDLARRLAGTYLAFLEQAQLPDGRFNNFMSYQRAWLDDVGTQDSCGRAMWALGFGARYAPADAWRRVCRSLLDAALSSIDWFEYLRPRAYALLGLAHAYPTLHEPRYTTAFRHLADALATAYDQHHRDDWSWFEETMTYDNARLPEALLRAGQAFSEARYGDRGLISLAFYEQVTIRDGIFVPIGNEGWYPRGGARAIYSQQPLEAYAMVDAELAAFDATGDAGHVAHAQTALAWYYGKNTRGAVMAHGGGCFDGIDENDVNRNMGAESTLALLAAAYAMEERPVRSLRAVR
jgi:hypothetical protein